MSNTAGEISGVTLEYVARKIEDEIKTTKTKFDNKQGENVQIETKIVDPIIVFFPNKSVQIMSAKRAETLGFLVQPEVMNLQQVEGTKSAAGRYKNSMTQEGRREAWMQLEQNVISACEQSSGHPLPMEEDEEGIMIAKRYSKNSIYIDAD